jgi:anti-anti-sigma regulatory factor
MGLEEVMLNVHIEKIGDVAVVQCEGRVVRSDAVFRLRDCVTQQTDARVVLLDLSEVESLGGGGLGMLVFLQQWGRKHGIELKLFDPPDPVRRSLERVSSTTEFDIASTDEILSLLGWEGRNCEMASQGDRHTSSSVLRL